MLSLSWRTILVFLSLFSSLALGYFLFQSNKEESKASYLTYRVSNKNIENSVVAKGVLFAKNQVDVGAQVTGQLIRLLVEEGQFVSKGQLLAEIDTTIAENQLMKAEAALARAEAELNMNITIMRQDKLALKRQEEMLKKEATSLPEFETITAKLAMSETSVVLSKAALKAAQIDVDTAKTELNYNRIVAPIDGVVLSILVKEGQTIVSSQVVPTLLSLADLHSMTIKAKISEVDVLNIRTGTPVYFTLLGEPSKRYNAKLKGIQLAPTNIGQSTFDSGHEGVYYNALFDVEYDSQALRIGMTALVNITQSKRDNVLVIPVSSVIIKNKVTMVDALIGGNTIRKTVTLGIKDATYVEVVEGLNLNDEIIISTGKGL